MFHVPDSPWDTDNQLTSDSDPTMRIYIGDTSESHLQNEELPVASMQSKTAPGGSPHEPPLFDATPESLIQDSRRLIEQARKVQDEVVNTIPPEAATFATVVSPLAQAENLLARKSHIIKLYQAVSPDPELRDASNRTKKLFSDFAIETALREDLFVLINAVSKGSEKADLDAEATLYLQTEHRKYLSNGLGLPAGPARARIREIRKRMSELSIEFQRNLNEDSSGIWFTSEELDGVPEDTLRRLEVGTADGEGRGKLRLTFQYPDYFPAMDFAKNEETRKRVFLGNENRCKQNVPLFQETLLLRDEAARMLGYPNHAAFRLEDKMVKSPYAINSFLQDLRSRLVARRDQELQKLKDLKQSDLGDQSYNGHYYLWDQRFYNRMMLEQRFSVDQQKFAEYFPLYTTTMAMLHTFERLFGLAFVEYHKEDQSHARHVWHDDVRLFGVWDSEDEGGAFIGYLYLDLYPRPGKFSHTANFNVQPGFTDSTNTHHHPSTALICNFPAPMPSSPTLLKHFDLLSLFHELGHGIHDLVARTTYARFHGTMTVQDFCEAPSQMLENWCWDIGYLQELSSHYVTGEKLPEQMARDVVR
ncbi:MAG: hypothetical protein Q9174_002227, partial [Haloplaca sp. 1 TL-2023]